MTNDLLFDIGCNRGQFTDANIESFNKLILIEANPFLIEFINKKYQDTSKIQIINAKVSNTKNGDFYICSNDGCSSADIEWTNISRFVNQVTWNKVENIPTISIDELIYKYGSPSLIKIDVEGYELNVCRSLTVKVPLLCFEWAEEKLDDIINTILYLKTIEFNYFSIQIEDNYTYRPEEKSYISYEQIINWFKQNCDVKRKQLWGMIWCK